MNKSEFIHELSLRADMSKKDVAGVLKSFVDVVTDALQKDEKVSLVGFGTFQVVERKATTGINPKTKEKIQIAPKKFAKLKFSNTVNDIINGKVDSTES